MKIVVAEPALQAARPEFEAALPDGMAVTWVDKSDQQAVADALADADVLVSSRCTTAQAAAGTGLRLVHAAGAGTDEIEVGSLPPGTMVANTFHHEDSMAEFVVAATIVLRRGILTQDAAMRKGVWASPGYNRMALSSTLQGAEIGFVGFGHIGATVWERFRAFGARGSAITRRGDVDAAAHGLERTGTVADLPAVLESADVVVVSAPLTPETTGLIGAAELARMRGSALLVNVGRGPIIEQGALYAALRDRTIAGAAIDVWYDYPGADGIGYPSVQPFHELDNVIMSPHSSAQTRQTFQQRAVEIAANIGRHAAGEPLVNLVAVVPAEQDAPAR